jgi:hypothetical protein
MFGNSTVSSCTWAAALKQQTVRVVLVVSLVFAVLVAVRYYGVNKLDREIRARVEQKLRDHYRGLQVSVRSARRLDQRGLEIRGVIIQEAGGKQAPMIAEIEEAIIHCDTSLPELLTKHPQITRVELRRVKWRAERKPSGVWNVSHLFPLPSYEGEAPPSATISDGTVEIIDPSQGKTTPLTLRNIELKIDSESPSPEPTGLSVVLGENAAAQPPRNTTLKVQGSVAGDHFERVELAGSIQPESGSWQVSGAVEGLEFSPRLRAALPREAGELLAPLSSVRGRSQFVFRVTSPTTIALQQGAKLDFVVHGQIAEGRIDDERLPDPLTDVEATIRVNPQGVWVNELTGRCGPAFLQLNAELRGFSLNSPWQVDLLAERLNLDRLTVSALPRSLQDVWSSFQPRGIVDVRTKLVSDGHQWKPDVTVKCHNLSLQYDKFPYRMTDSTGTLELKDDHLKVRLEMIGGGKIIACRAEIDRPGPDFTGWVQLHSQGGPLAIDDRLLNALSPETQLIVRKFQPRGAISFQATLQRADAQAELDRRLTINLHDLTIQHDAFSYPIDRVNGSLKMTNDYWDFHNLSGRNDSGYIVGHGNWNPSAPDGNQLQLQFTASDLPLEDELRRALSPAIQRVWLNLRPRGNIDHLVVDFKYNPTSKQSSIAVDAEKWPPNRNIEGRSITVEPTWFRYALDNVTGRFQYRDGETTLQNVTASHGRLTLQTEGQTQLLPDGSCRVQLSRVTADRIQVDHELLAALPSGFATAVSRLAITGPLNMQGATIITVPGNPDQPPQVDWNLNFDIENGSLTAGVPIEHIHGSVRLVGRNHATSFENRGELNVDSAVVRDVQLTQIRGPLLFDAEQLRFGSWAERDLPDRVPRQLTANVFGGAVALDGQMRFGSELPFQLQVWLEQGDLAKIAREVAPRQQRLGGKVFAVVSLSGTGEGVHTYRGQGQVRLRDADIYELPAIIAMLKLSSIQNPDRTAFTQSNIDFRIEGDDLELDRIELAGDAITLKGRGRLTSAREIDMQLYTQMGRDDAQIPIFRPLIGEASRQFLLFEVTGSVDNPQVQRQVFPQLNERLQDLFPELSQFATSRKTEERTISSTIREAARDTLTPWRR